MLRAYSELIEPSVVTIRCLLYSTDRVPSVHCRDAIPLLRCSISRPIPFWNGVSVSAKLSVASLPLS